MRVLTLTAATAAYLFLAHVSNAQNELPAGPTATAGQPQGQPPGQQSAPGQQGGAPAQDDPAFRQQVSYALGQHFAENLKENDVALDLNALVAGISDVLSGAKPKFTDEQLKPTMQRFSREMQQKAMFRMQNMAAKNKQAADTFLAQNGKREGVQTTPSGLQYVVLKQAEGPSPTLNDTVRCKYRGTLLNGTEFDNSANHGGQAEFTIAPGLIKGWIEALQKMHVGEKWQLFVPPGLAYELDPPGPPIEPNSLLVFEIELMEIVPQQQR